MSEPIHYDVIVVGAGLVGSAIACALAADVRGQELRIAVIEAGEQPRQYTDTDFDPRVVALTHASQTLLDEVGAWRLIEQERICPYTDMDVWDADGTGNIHFDCRDVQQPCLGHIVENSVITRALMTRLRSFPQIDLVQPARVKHVLTSASDAEDAVEVILEDGRRLQAALLLAADGANSQVRSLANMATREWHYGQDAIVTTARTSLAHQFTAWQRFLPTGPLAFLPLQAATDAGVDCHYSSIVWSVDSERAPELMALSDEAFKTRLEQAFEQRLGQVETVARRYSFPLRQRHAVDYIKPGIALLGDAAHTVHPLAGQGVNLGFLDVMAMRAEILRACQRQLPLSDYSILKRYQRARKSHNLGMMGMMEGFKRLFGADQLPVRWMRNEGMRRLNSLPLLKNAVVKQAMGL